MPTTIDFANLFRSPILDLDTCRAQIKTHLVSEGGKLKPSSTWVEFLDKRDLGDLYSSIMYWGESDKWSEAVAWVCRNPGDGACHVCGERCALINFKTGFRRFCSSRCSAINNIPLHSDESKQLRKERHAAAMRDTRLGITFPDEWKANLSKAAQRPEVKAKKAETCLQRYGVKNPGIRGAYSSKAAALFISEFLRINKIGTGRCMMHGTGKGEFYQMIDVPFVDKKLYVSFDLIVFESVEACKAMDTSKISIALEYNGPWHYTETDCEGCENDPATPYSNNRFSKEQQYLVDGAKARRLKSLGVPFVLSYWERSGKFQAH